MNINRDFINQFVLSFHDSIMEDGQLCEFSDTLPENGSYDNVTYQKIYALRFIPAYYFEYCILAEELKNRLLPDGPNAINIASFGCGLYPDYYALSHNMDGINFHYTGYDVCRWESRALLPAHIGNITFNNASIDDITQHELNQYDVFFFPKSLGDIAANANLNAFAEKIAQISKERIFFLNSFISTEHRRNDHHINIFGTIDSALTRMGFECADDRTETYYNYQGENRSHGLKRINHNFHYPDILPICRDDCEEACNANKSPVFTNMFMNYQLLEYTR